MKNLILFTIIFLISNQAFSQDITNTLGTDGEFIVKDGSTTFFTLDQTHGHINLPYSKSSTKGFIFKEGDRFLHNYAPSLANGYNTFLGINAGNFDMSGLLTYASYNTGIGHSSLFSNTTGRSNTAVGYRSLYSNTTGYFNTALGMSSLYFNETGYYNTALGQYSLSGNTTGLHNTAVGYISLNMNTTGNFNTAVGYSSLCKNTTGYENTALGDQSLYSNTEGRFNTAIGYQSLNSNTTGRSNTAVGNYTLTDNIGDYNTGMGNLSLCLNTIGDYNTAIGYQSLYSNIEGRYNTAIGYQSLYSIINYEYWGYNTAVGNRAGYDITIGENNTCLGNDAQVPDGSSSNQVRIGNTSVGYAGIQVAWSVTSDKRWKKDILPVKLGLDFVSKLNPVSYVRKNDENKKTEYGFIAQEIEEILEEYNVDNSGMITIDNEGKYELRYNDLLAPMVKAIQELNDKNESLEEEIAQLKSEIESLKVVNEKLVKLEKLIMEIKTNQNEIKEIKTSSN